MKKMSILLLTIILFLFLSINSSANYEINLSIKFYDNNLESAIREVLNKNTGALTKSDVLNITQLDLSNKDISDLRGIEELIYLEDLNLSKNDLDLNSTSVLGNLIYLKDLNLRETGVNNITFLRNLLLLEKLNLHSNPIDSIKPINNLYNLEELIMRNVDIGDEVIYLKNLTKLNQLNVRNTNIYDFSVIIGLMQKGALQQVGSSIDIIDNPGLNNAKSAFIPYWNNISERSPDKIDTILPPSVSHESGFYTTEFNLELNSNNKNSTIYYTLDGSEPRKDNINGTTYYIKQTYPYGQLEQRRYQTLKYNQPINIYNKSDDSNSISMINPTFDNNYLKPATKVFKTNIVKAIECTNDGYCSETITNTYFVHPKIKSYFNLPIVSITANEDDLFGYNEGIYVPGKIYNNWKVNNLYTTPDGSTPANYNQRSNEWEKLANISFFETDGTLGFTQDVGISIQGAYSRAFARKSLRIYARNEYDDSNSIYYDIFPDLNKKANQTTPITDFKRLILRNGGNLADTQFYSDALMQSLVSHLSFDTQSYRPAIQFINGEYWGITNIRERYDEFYLKSHYDIDENSAVIISNYGDVEVGYPNDANDMYNLRDYVLTRDMKNTNNYNYVKSKLDIQNFIEYNVANIYFANTDWPGNNVRFWRKRTTDVNNTEYGHDGKWRFMLFDTDFGFGNITSRYNHETLPFATQAYHNNWPNPAWSTTLFRKLLNNPEFKKQFINTFADQLNTSFQPERVEDLINSIYKEVKNDLFDHYKRWNTPFINNNILIDFGNNRPNFLYNHINDFFKLAGTAQVTLKTNESDEDNMGHIRINSIDITSDYPGLENDLYFTGKYYKNNEITITAVPNPGYKFISWEGTNNTSSTLKVNLTNDIILRAIFIEDMDYVIDFYDPNLKRSLSTLLNKDEITVRNMLFIKELDLSNMNISNIEGLQYAINLTHLDLSNNNITDLKPIQNLKSIQTLNLGSNIYLSSLDTLSNLNTIEDLNLSNVYLGNKINLLANFQKLNRLNLRNTGISDISVLIPIIEAGAFQDRNSLDLRENEIQNYYLINNYYPNPPVPIEEFTNNPYVIDILITIPTILLSIFTIIITRKIYKNNRT